MNAEKEMTPTEHLEELRTRLIRSSIALVVTTLLSLLFAERLLKLLIRLAGNVRPVFLQPTEGFVTYMRVALLSGVGLAIPFIVYELLQFAAPGLEPKEKRYLYVALPAAAAFFLVGVAFAYWVMLPAALSYLAGFGRAIAEPTWAIGEYISFVTGLLFWVGIIFEMPLLVFILAKLGVVSPQMLSRNRRYAIIIIAILAAAITPTGDPFNMLLLMAPLLALYEISVWVAKAATH